MRHDLELLLTRVNQEKVLLLIGAITILIGFTGTRHPNGGRGCTKFRSYIGRCTVV